MAVAVDVLQVNLFSIVLLCIIDIILITSCRKMPQKFANDDLFDAELGEESDGGQNGDLSDEEGEYDSAPKSPQRDWIENQNHNNSDEEGANNSPDEETRHEEKKKPRKREAKKKVNFLLKLSCF